MTDETNGRSPREVDGDAPVASEIGSHHLALGHSMGEEAERAKFDVGTPPQIEGVPLPWGYGVDKIAALPRGPDTVYLYWELTDGGIRTARGRLGPAGEHGWLNLRVYDTTGKDFDGTNANHYVDASIARDERERFLVVQRPGSTAHVEVGVLSSEGYFQPIARSNRADFPRKSPSPNTWLEWMTVTSEDESPSVRPYHSRFAGGPQASFGAPAPPEDVSTYAAAVPAESTWTTARSWTVEERASTEWVTVSPRDLSELVDLPMLFQSWRAEWRSDLRLLRWKTEWPLTFSVTDVSLQKAGPFARLLVDPASVERVGFRFGGMTMLVPSEWGPVEVHGPWRVTIRGFEARPERRVLGSWTMHWARVLPVVHDRWAIGQTRQAIGAHGDTAALSFASESLASGQGGASEALGSGASEHLWASASAGLLGGASEELLLGARAEALGGASVLVIPGASELMAQGASEWLFLGASGWFFWGASERVFFGGSEWLFSSASEALAMGASEARLAGGSEKIAMGASDSVSSFALGSSEHVAGSHRDDMSAAKPPPTSRE